MPTTVQERETKRRLSTHYMEDILYEYLLHAGVAAKSLDLAAHLESRGIKVDVKFIRLTLAESSRFMVEDRRWNIGLRGEIRRPFSGLVEYSLQEYGRPMALDAMLNEMALVMRRPLDFFQSLLLTALTDEQKYFTTEAGEWGLREWLLDTSYENEDELFLRNFFFSQAETKEQLEEMHDTRMGTDQPADQMAIKLLRKIGHPVHHRVLSFALWKLRDGDVDPQQLYEELRSDERILPMSGAEWALLEWQDEWIAELKKLSKRAEKLEDLPWLEEEQEEKGFAVSEQDIKEMINFVKKHRRAVRMREILERVFEVVPASSRWDTAIHAVTDVLSRDGRLQRVGAQSWTIPSYIPKIEKVPRQLLLEEKKKSEDETDAELEDEGLDGGLAAWVRDPRFEEIGEEEEVDAVDEIQSAGEVRYVALGYHLKAGTAKLRKVDGNFYPTEADQVCLVFRDEEAKSELEVWGSRQTGLLFGLDSWYEDRDIQPGAVFTLTKGEEPDDYLITFSGEYDPLLTVTPERQKILRSLKREAAEKNWPVFEIMCRIMADYEKGIPFLTLWTEANLVRRTRKRTIASNLSSYHCFSQRPANADNWTFDERRVSLGRKKTKRHFIRTAQ